MHSQEILLTSSSRTGWKLPLARPELLLAARAMLAFAGQSGAGLEIALVDDPGMAELNRLYLGCDGPTNCLSFPAGAGAGGLLPEIGVPRTSPEFSAASLGWLALSTDTLLREAFLYGQDPVLHCLTLLAHGLAHLQGHDHGPAMDSLASGMFEAGRAALEL